MSRKLFSTLLAAALLLMAALPAGPAEAAPRKVTIAPSGSLLLPEGWTVTDPAVAAKQIHEAKENLGITISSSTVFFAVKNNPNQEQLACVALERTQASPLNNNIIPLLTPEEKEEVYANMRLVMSGAFQMAGAPVEITETTFKDFGRYHTLIMSLQQPGGHNPVNSHVVYYFLPEATHILTVVYNAEAAKELNPDFTAIMNSFDPDGGYEPTPAPARKDGENLHDYLGRIYKAE